MTQRMVSPASVARLITGWWLSVMLLLPQLAAADPATPPPKLGLPRDAVCADAVREDLSTRTQTLLANCRTDQSLVVPDGWTFDGDGHTITAVEPLGGRFTGGVVSVYDGVGQVRDVTIDGSRLTAPCLVDQAHSFFSGVLFFNATGSITDVTVRNLHRRLPDTTEARRQDERMSCGTGIAVLAATTPVLVTRNRVSNVGNAAVWIEGSRATVSRNTIDRAADSGILALLGAEVQIGPGNRISDGTIGIQFESAGTSGSATNNTIEAITQIGIAVTFGAEAIIADTTLRDIGINGIAVEGEGSQATVEDTIIDRASETGIKVITGAATLNRNSVTDSRTGMLVASGANVALAANSVTATRHSTDEDDDIGQFGVFIAGEGTTATITANRIEQMFGAGIVIRDGAAASDVSANIVLETRFGIAVIGEKSEASIVENTIGEIEQIGISVESVATAEVRGNHVTRAGRGVSVSGVGATASIAANRIERTTDLGILLQPGTQTTVSENTLVAPGTHGIHAYGAGTKTTITDNLVTGAQSTGILIEDGAEAVVGAGNRVSHVGWGIMVAGQGTSAAVTGNTLSGLTRQAITVRAGAAGTVRDNDITGGNPGILVFNHRAVTVEGNTIRDAEPTAIVIERDRQSSGAPLPITAGPVTIVTLDIAFAPNAVAIPADREVTFFLRNDGASPHSFVIDALGIAVDLTPDETKEIAVNAPAGSYQFFCHVLGHYQAGMVGTLTAGGDPDQPVPELPIADFVRRNTIEGGAHGIVATGDGVAVAIEENRITGVAQTALSIEAGAHAELRANIVSGAELGLNITGPGTTVTAEGTRIYDSVSHSVHIQNGAAAELRRNVVTRPGASGIVVGGSATTATLTGNVISRAAKTGISVEHGADATIGLGNLVSGGTWGIAIIGEDTTAEVLRSQVRDASNQGIAVVRGAQATMRGNTVSGGETGIYVRNLGTHAVIAGNTVSLADQGIYVWEGAVAEQIADNTIKDSIAGVLVAGTGTRADLVGNRVVSETRGMSKGIAVMDGATADLSHNSVTGSHSWAVFVAGDDTHATVRENELNGIGGTGIQFSQGAEGTVRDNTISTTNTGIRAIDRATIVSLIGNTLLGPGAFGITVAAATATIEENTIGGATRAGIMLSSQARAEVAANAVTAPQRSDFSLDGTSGIAATWGVSGEIQDNQAAGYGCGIRIASGAPNILVQDNSFPDPGNESDICDRRADGTPIASPVAATPQATPLPAPNRERESEQA